MSEAYQQAEAARLAAAAEEAERIQRQLNEQRAQREAEEAARKAAEDFADARRQADREREAKFEAAEELKRASAAARLQGGEAQQSAYNAGHEAALAGKVKYIGLSRKLESLLGAVGDFDAAIAAQQKIVDDADAIKAVNPAGVTDESYRAASDNLVKLKADRAGLAEGYAAGVNKLEVYNAQINLLNVGAGGPGLEYVLHQGDVYTVTYTVGGVEKTDSFTDLSAAQQFVEGLKKQGKTPNYGGRPIALNTQGQFVDAAGMEGYVEALGIPITGSGVQVPGFVDVKIAEVSAGIHRFGDKIEAEAEAAKLAGYDLAAWIMASEAIATGAISSVFDVYTSVLNLSPTDVVDLGDVGAAAAKVAGGAGVGEAIGGVEDPLFKAGYIGGLVGVVSIAAADLASAVRASEAYKAFGKPGLGTGAVDEFGLLPTDYTGLPGPYGVDVPFEYPIGSREYEVALQMGREPIALAVGWSDDALLGLLDLDASAALPALRADVSGVGGMDVFGVLAGVSLLSKLGSDAAVIEAVPPASVLAGVKPIQVPAEMTVLVSPVIEDVVPVVAPVVVQVEATDIIVGTGESVVTEEDVIVVVDPFTKTIHDPIMDTIQDPAVASIQEPIIGLVIPPPPEPPDIGGSKRPLILKIGGGDAKRGGPGGGVAAGAGRFRVVLDGRASVVSADSFVSALSAVSHGKGRGATVTRIS